MNATWRGWPDEKSQTGFSVGSYWLPKYAGAMLAAFLPRDRRDDLLADLDEEFDLLTTTIGAGFARRWYAAQLCRSITPIIGQWLRLKASASIANAKVPSIGTIFFALAIAWFACVTWTLQPDSAPRGQIATSTGEWEPNAVSLEDGSAHLVYSLGGRDSAGNSETPAMIRLSILALGPPAVAAIGLLLVLSIIGGRGSSLGYGVSAKLKR